MYFEIFLGIITGLGLYTGVRTIIDNSKKRGALQLALSIIAPLLAELWCLKKTNFVFGGTNWEFLVQTATVDKMIEPWLILVLYLFLIGLTLHNIMKLRENSK